MRACGHQLVAAVVLVVALTACSEPVPAAKVDRTSPTPAASETTSASPTPTKLTPEQEVEAAVRAYYAELTRAAQTNDTSKLKTLMRKNCPCYRAVRVIERGAQRGERTPDLEWRLQGLEIHDLSEGVVGVEVRYSVTGHDVVDASGKVIESFPATTEHMDLSLVKQSSTWVVANVFDLEG